MNGFSAAAAAAMSGAFLFGLVLPFLRSLQPALAKRLDLSEGQSNRLLTGLHLTFAPMVFVAGLLADRTDLRLLLAVGSVLTAGSLYGLTVRRTYGSAAVAVLGAGLGSALVCAASVVSMPRVFFGGDPNRTTAALSLGSAFIALGALVAPTLADTLLRAFVFRWAVGAASALCLVPAGIALLAGESKLFEPVGSTDLERVLGDGRVWLAGLALCLYAPVELTVGAWATTYLPELGFKSRRAARLLTGFWLAFVAARVGLAYLQDAGALGPRADVVIIPVAALATAILLGNLVGTPSGGRAAWGLLLLGAVLGLIFPCVVSAVFQVPSLQDARGAVFGVVGGLGALGGLVLAPVTTRLMKVLPVHRAPLLLLGLALLLAAAALVMGLVGR